MAVRKIVRKTKTVWEVSYRDASNKKRYVLCGTRAEALKVQAEKVGAGGANPHVTVGELADRWLELARSRVRKRSLISYAHDVAAHILPAFGQTKASKVKPTDVDIFLAGRTAIGLSPNSVRRIRSSLHGILKLAVKDGVIAANPVAFSMPARKREPEHVKAMTAEQLVLFLDATRARYPWLYPCFLTMARTGLRIGEAIALRWSDVDFDSALIHVRRTMITDGTLEPPKTGRFRTVDVSAELGDELRRQYRLSLEERLRRGRPVDALEDWVFRRPVGGHLRLHSIARQVKRVLKDAGLPRHFHSHSLRHTYASLHLQRGTPIVYVKEQPGHASINMTVDTYGHHLSKSNPEFASHLDRELPPAIERAAGEDDSAE